jgi:hypothetical protein
MNIPAWTVERILRPLSLDPPKPFVALNVKKRISRKKCLLLPSRERSGSSGPAVLQVAAVVPPIIVPLAIRNSEKSEG